MDAGNSHAASCRARLARMATGLASLAFVASALADPDTGGRRPVPSAAAPATYEAFIEQMTAAARLNDPLQRCLHMPDPPGSHWHADGAAAYCRYRNSVTLGADDIIRLVTAGKAAAVDDAFEGYRHAQLNDPNQAGLLDVAVMNGGFRRATPAMRKAIDGWKRQRPHSAFAVAASGIQYLAAAQQARGSAYGSETSDDQWAGMRAQAKLARGEFDKATRMSPAVPSMYADMFSLGRLTGDTEYAIAALEKGVQIDRTNLALRLTSASMSSRKWGGSDGWLAKLESDAADLAPTHPLLWVAVSRAHIEAVTDGQRQPPPGGRYVDAANDAATSTALGDLADSARRAGNRQDATILALEALRFNDGEFWALYTIGRLNANAPRAPWVMDALRRAGNNPQTEPDALGVAALWMHYMGDTSDAPRLIDAAFARGLDDAWVLHHVGEYYVHAGQHYDRAAMIADRLVHIPGSEASGYFLRANTQIAMGSPTRYKAIKDYLDRFGDAASEAENVTAVREYLQAHPE